MLSENTSGRERSDCVPNSSVVVIVAKLGQLDASQEKNVAPGTVAMIVSGYASTM